MSKLLSSYLIMTQIRTGTLLTNGAAVSTSLIVRGSASCIVISPFNKYVCIACYDCDEYLRLKNICTQSHLVSKQVLN